MGVAFSVAALGESLAQEAEGVVVVREGSDRRLVVLGPLEQVAVG